ncbi:hypothetical protein KCP74_09845 [Salmonella enterica subsp. enterica]|nr:hypothetical protein KCP74_09845 [Salmonella enterica subsp. enterica]
MPGLFAAGRQRVPLLSPKPPAGTGGSVFVLYPAVMQSWQSYVTPMLYVFPLRGAA